MSYEDLPLFAEPSQDTPPAQIVCDDVLAWAEKYDGAPFHAMLCDSPYELGFMGRDWDRSGIAFKPDTWKAFAQHLLPGAFGMCFASSRGFHRLMVAIEDAGLIIHPAIFNYRSGEVIEVPELYGFCYGSGFPKASRIDTQVDKASGAERQVIGSKWVTNCATAHQDGYRRIGGKHGYDSGKAIGGEIDITAPATPLAQSWAGHRYGLQALKPALEPIIVWQKPYQGKPVQSITQTGAGALNIDGGRLDTGSPPVRDNSHMSSKGYPGGKYGNTAAHGHYEKIGLGTEVNGRWPANFALCHTPECVQVGTRQVKASGVSRSFHGAYEGTSNTGFLRGNSHQGNQHDDGSGHETVAAWQCAMGCPVAALDAQAGVRTSGQMRAGTIRANRDGYTGPMPAQTLQETYGDSGKVSRFFMTADWSLDIAERLTQADPVFYAAKASRRERDSGLEGMPLHETIRYSEQGQGPLAQQTPRKPVQQRNVHPTVKPLKLCQWLATLLLPPDAYAPRRLLVPFCGTASEGIGAILAGWDEIVMVDSNQEYCNIARARISYWEQHRDAKHR